MPKPKFPDEPITKPAPRAQRQVSGAAPTADRKKASEVPTMPPPRPHTGTHAKVPRADAAPKTSAMRPKRPGSTSATVDTVVADLTHDPRAESDDDDE